LSEGLPSRFDIWEHPAATTVAVITIPIHHIALWRMDDPPLD
jgi:hypothetical protein